MSQKEIEAIRAELPPCPPTLLPPEAQVTTDRQLSRASSAPQLRLGPSPHPFGASALRLWITPVGT